MTNPTKLVNGVAVPMTDDEVIARNAEEAAFASSILSRAAFKASNDIDSFAGQVRLKYITSVPGQDATYLSKATQADSYKAAGYTGTVPVLVQAEADATGMTTHQAADYIIATRDAWNTIAANIERERRKGKIAVAAAVDIAGVNTALAAALTALQAL